MPGSITWQAASIPASPAGAPAVQFARVLAQIWQAPDEPQQALLLLDEPTSALDLKYQHQLLTMARALAARNTAVLVVLHDLNLAGVTPTGW
jgi:ABC-type hemin transport system ATPase subunit